MLPVSDFNYKNRSHLALSRNIQPNPSSINLNMLGKVKLRILVVSSIAFFALVFAQLVFASNLATDGHRLGEINDQMEQLEQENVRLKVEIAKKSSLSNLSNQAKDLGFDKPTQVIAF